MLNFMAVYWPQGWTRDTVDFGKPIWNPWGQYSSISWYPFVSFFFHLALQASSHSHDFTHCFGWALSLWGTRTIALDPTFGSFTLLELISHEGNRLLWWKCLDCLDSNGLFWCSECGQSNRCTTSYLLAGPTCLWCLVFTCSVNL
jgi:hypothetical protein